MIKEGDFLAMINIEQAKLDPSSVFQRPHDVVDEDTLSRADKIDILRRWAYDEREISVAEEENMQSNSDQHQIILDEVLKSLLELGVEGDQDEPPPTKQG